MTSLVARAFAGLLFVLVVMGALLFFTAGTLSYWQAWVYLALFGVSGSAITAYLVRKDPALLERRIRGGPTAEKEASQRAAMTIASIGFVAIFALAGLDHRWQWSMVPSSAAIAGDVLFMLGWAIVFFVFKENPFTSATIEVASDQRVVSTGPYAVVRHPMYSGSFLYLLGTPLALGSWWGFIGVLLLMPAVVWRLLDEERLLAKSLPGYSEYRDSVKFRLMPFIW
jgi:protein-S-isoprenylcysteine O-methyltransferase Ste14